MLKSFHGLSKGLNMIIYNGKSKEVRVLDSDNRYVDLYFKDDVTAFNGVKHDVINYKGVLNCQISKFFMEMFSNNGINTHFIDLIDQRTQRCKHVEIIPIEVVVRNIAAGSLCKRFGIEKGTKISEGGINGKDPLVEFFYKSDELGDPPMSRSHALLLNMATDEELDFMKKTALKINQLMSDFWRSVRIDLIDFKLEFGRFENEILLADEMTPDACRLWKTGTQISMDKDVYRYDVGNLAETYSDLYSLIQKTQAW